MREMVEPVVYGNLNRLIILSGVLNNSLICNNTSRRIQKRLVSEEVSLFIGIAIRALLIE
jgi:hypothetical protein